MVDVSQDCDLPHTHSGPITAILALWGSRMRRMLLTCGDRWPHRPGMIVAVSLRLLYLIFQQVPGQVLLIGRTTYSKDVEPLVLRHEVTVLRRTNPQPRMDWADRAIFAALIQRLSQALRLKHCVASAWSLRTRSCAGIAASSAEGGHTRTSPDGHRSTTSSSH